MKKWGLLICMVAMALVSATHFTASVSKAAIYDPDPYVTVGTDIFDPDPIFVTPNTL